MQKVLTMRFEKAPAEKPELIVLMLNPGSCGKEVAYQPDCAIAVRPDATRLSYSKTDAGQQPIRCVQILNL